MATKSKRGLFARFASALPTFRRTASPSVDATDKSDVPKPELCPRDCDGVEEIGPSLSTIADVHGDDFDWFLVQDAPINEGAVVTVCGDCGGITDMLGANH